MPPISRLVYRLAHDLDAGVAASAIGAQEFVMVARDEDDAGAVVDLAQNLMHYAAVCVVPEPAALELPAIDDVAHEIERAAAVPAEKIRQQLGLATSGAQMQVRDEDRPVMAGGAGRVRRKSRPWRLRRELGRGNQPGDIGHLPRSLLCPGATNQQLLVGRFSSGLARIFCCGPKTTA